MSKQKSTKREKKKDKNGYFRFPQTNGLCVSFCGFLLLFVGRDDMAVGGGRRSRRTSLKVSYCPTKRDREPVVWGVGGWDGIYWRPSSFFYFFCVFLLCAMGYGV